MPDNGGDFKLGAALQVIFSGKAETAVHRIGFDFPARAVVHFKAHGILPHKFVYCIGGRPQIFGINALPIQRGKDALPLRRAKAETVFQRISIAFLQRGKAGGNFLMEGLLVALFFLTQNFPFRMGER